jgi:hypothetical protein
MNPDGNYLRLDMAKLTDEILPMRIGKAFHAVSLDELRVDFTPSLWRPGQECVTQRIFPGAHAHVGGGYPANESGLSDGALVWMKR